MFKALVGAAAALAVACAAAPSASAHAILVRDGATLAFRATDFVSHNDISVTTTGDAISMIDSTGLGGLDPGDCRPGRVDLDTGNVIEGTCDADGVERIRVNAGEREDDIVATVAMPVYAIGGGGIDRIQTGPANDIIDGGRGADRITAGLGSDAIYGGDGDDIILARDGAKDVVVCGAGRDAVDVDPIDELAADCEAAPAQPLADDTAPVVRIAVARRQRAARRITLRAAADEPVRFVAQAAMIVADQTFPLRPGRGVLTPPGAVLLRPELEASEVRIARRALRRGQKVEVVVSVVATDAAGNSSLRNLPTIRLRR